MTDVLALHNRLGKDRVDREMTEYYSLFNNEGKSTKENEQRRVENYKTLSTNFYDLVTDFYEYGWGESFHFAPRHKLETFDQSIARYELYVALRLGLQPGMKCLDVGCGVGGPMREIARFSGSHITGLNINDYQLERSRLHNKRDGLDNICDLLKKGDFMNVPVPDDTYDAIYEIEATCHAPSKEGVYAEMYRLLKPGGCFAGYEWCMTEHYDPNNELHKQIKYGIEIGNGLPSMPLAKEFQAALRKVGFEIIELTNFGEITPQNPIGWWDTLDGKFTISNFRFTRIGRWLTAKLVAGLESIRLAPKGSLETALLLNRTAEDLVKGGQLGIFSPSFFFLVRKPADAPKGTNSKKVSVESKETNKKEQ